MQYTLLLEKTHPYQKKLFLVCPKEESCLSKHSLSNLSSQQHHTQAKHIFLKTLLCYFRNHTHLDYFLLLWLVFLSCLCGLLLLYSTLIYPLGSFSLYTLWVPRLQHSAYDEDSHVSSTSPNLFWLICITVCWTSCPTNRPTLYT